MSRRESAEATADQITDLAEKRRAEALTITGAGKPAARAKRPTAKAAAPKDLTRYTNMRIRKSHYRMLSLEGRRREDDDDLDTRHGISSVVRDVFDYYQAHKEAVDEWIARQKR